MVDTNPNISLASFIVALMKPREGHRILKECLERNLGTFGLTIAGPNSSDASGFGQIVDVLPSKPNEIQKSSNFPPNPWRGSVNWLGYQGTSLGLVLYSWIHKSGILTGAGIASNETDKEFYHSLPGEDIWEGEVCSVPFLA